MESSDFETSAVFRELVDEVRGLEKRLYEGPNAPRDEQSVLEGYKWIFSILQVGMDAHVWGDSANPRFVDITCCIRAVSGPFNDQWEQNSLTQHGDSKPVNDDDLLSIDARRETMVHLRTIDVRMCQVAPVKRMVTT